MSRRVRQSVSLLLVVTWCVASLVAMVWHPHDHAHGDCCQTEECEKPSGTRKLVHRHSHSHPCGHSHSHDGHRHSNEHSHEPSDENPDDGSVPHSPETCPSCQFLAISVLVPHHVQVSLIDTLVVPYSAVLPTAIERDRPTTRHLRGPPVTSMS